MSPAGSGPGVGEGLGLGDAAGEGLGLVTGAGEGDGLLLPPLQLPYRDWQPLPQWLTVMPHEPH